MEKEHLTSPSSNSITGENMKDFLKEYRVEKAKNDFFYKTSTLLIASFGLVAALAWEDAMKDLFQYLFGDIGTLHAKLIYALAVTLIAVAVSLILRRITLTKASKESELPEE